ncbi:MAG: RsmE family RNA methyltransferase [Acidimicrobiales bacterium]
MPAGPWPAAPEPALLSAAAMVFVENPDAPVVTAADAHHLVDVLRLRPGDPVIASDGAGRWVPCRLGAAAAGRGARGVDPAALLAPGGPGGRQERPAPPVTVAFVPTKGDRPEWAAQKLTELGVDRIVPLRSHRSVVRWDGERGVRAVERLRRVAREAAAQCRRTWLPEVTAVCSLDELASLAGGPVCLARPGAGPPRLDRPVVAVGPEGGWDDEEQARFPEGIGLGPTVLRAETAAVVAGTVLCGLRNAVVAPLA